MKTKSRTFTPIDLFVQTYIMDHPRKIEYHPGDIVSFKTSIMVSPEIEELLAAVDDLGLRVHFEGHLVIWEAPEDDDETKIYEEEHRAPTPEEIEAMRLEDETPDIESPEARRTREAKEESDRIEREMRELDQEPGRIVKLTEENLEVARDIIAMAEGTPLENTIPLWVKNAVKVDDAEAVAIEEPVRTYAETEADEEAVAVEVEEEIFPEELREIPDGEEDLET